MNAAHLRQYIIRPALFAIDLHSDAAEELVLGTAAQESRFLYVRQLGGGPGLGFWQMEPATYRDIWENYLAFNPTLRAAVMNIAGRAQDEHPPEAELMIGYLQFAAAMCRVHYRRVPHPLPKAGDVAAQAGYWKRYYNTSLGKGTVDQYLASWDKYVVNG